MSRMSVSVNGADGPTVLTFTPDPQSCCPPLCQILKCLCYSPVCYSPSQHLRNIQRMFQSILAALHIMVGLHHIGLGAVLLTSGGAREQMAVIIFPVWMGALFMLFGIMCILSEKYPSPCLVTVNVILNLAGVVFALAAAILYINNGMVINVSMCHPESYDDYLRSPSETQSPYQPVLHSTCLEGKAVIEQLIGGITNVLIVLSVLELCLTISSATLGIKALKARDQNKRIHDAVVEDTK